MPSLLPAVGANPAWHLEEGVCGECEWGGRAPLTSHA